MKQSHKTLLLWVLLIMMFLAIWQFLSPDSRPATQVAFSEFMRIETKDGALVYTPRIGSKQTPVEFRLKSQSEREVVFENPAHDFPQRILYRRNGDELLGRIEGTENGKTRSEDFPMNRVSCP